MFRMSVVALAALFGGAFACSFVSTLIPQDVVLPWVAAVLAAAVCGWGSFRVYLVGVFVFAAAAAYIATLHYGAGQGTPDEVRYAADAIALACGLVSLWLQKVAVSLATAWLGAFSFLIAVELFIGRIQLDIAFFNRVMSGGFTTERNVLLIGATLLGIVGFTVQMFSHFSPEEAPGKSAKKPKKKPA